MTRLDSEVRGAGLISPVAVLEYRALVTGQPLVLSRERHNPADANAIVASTVLLQPCGYIARQQAKIIAPEMDRGVLWLCKVTAPKCAGRWAQVILWKERGAAQKFKDLAIAYGATEAVADAIVKKKYFPFD